MTRTIPHAIATRKNPNDDLDLGYTYADEADYEARLEALPFALLRAVACGGMTLEQAEDIA